MGRSYEAASATIADQGGVVTAVEYVQADLASSRRLATPAVSFW